MSSGSKPAPGVAGGNSGKQPGHLRPEVFARLEPLFAELFQRSGAARFGISAQDFSQILMEVAEKYLAATDKQDAARDLLSTVRVEELALARACAAGNEKAWEVFLTRYREKLYDAGCTIARNDSVGRELADSLYADLYGTGTREGARVSKLNSYMGRGSLEGWLRTVLAQTFVDRYRSQRRLVSLEEKDDEGVQFAAPVPEPSAEVDPRLDQAADAALGALSAEDRLVLAAYFLDGRTLAEIARVLGVHESTVSRRVEKITASLRKSIRDGLIRRGMSRRQAEEALAADVRDLRVNVRQRLAQETAGSSFSDKRAGAPASGEKP